MSVPFRSHLMQQFAAMARTQSRPPIALFSLSGSSREDNSSMTKMNNMAYVEKQVSASHQLSSVSGGPCSIHNSSTARFSSTQSISCTDKEDDIDTSTNTPSRAASNFQHLISTRRTVSNFQLSSPSTAREDTANISFLREAIKRGVECALTAPNHKMTEPTTFYRIIAPSSASEKLLDIVYEVTLKRLLNQKLCGLEACKSEAARKREKWSNIPAFLVATVGGMNDQVQSPNSNHGEHFLELPVVPPSDTRQLEDYASACSSIQNLLLSLHSEGLGSKWTTGPIIRTLAFRELVGCKVDDMVVGLIFIGWPKRQPRMPRRRRELNGDMLRDL